MTYELIGTPEVQSEYSNTWETTMVINLMREDGVLGDVWIVAGVPDYHRGSAEAAASNRGYETVRVFGDSPDTWLPASFRDESLESYQDVAESVVEACRSAALEAHHEEEGKGRVGIRISEGGQVLGTLWQHMSAAEAEEALSECDLLGSILSDWTGTWEPSEPEIGSNCVYEVVER